MSDMHINSLVGNWDTLHNTARSLINFFMKGAKIYVHGVYEDGLYKGLTCNVQYKYKVYDVEADPVTPTCYLLNLPLTTYIDSINNGDLTYPVEVNEDSGMLPLIKSPLIRKSSRLNFLTYYKESSGSDSGSDSGSASGSDSGDDSDDAPYLATSLYDITAGTVDLIPMIGSDANIDESIRPSSIPSATDHTISVNAISNGSNLKSLYQLRTSTFKLSKSGQSDKVAYYKIGIMPFLHDVNAKTGASYGDTGTVDSRLSSIISDLKSGYFYLYGSSATAQLGFLDSNEWGQKYAVETSLGDYTEKSAIPGSIIMPIAYEDLGDVYIKGIAYLQMFEGTDESNVTYLSGYTVKYSDDNDYWYDVTADDYFQITDEHLSDGDFVPRHRD